MQTRLVRLAGKSASSTGGGGGGENFNAPSAATRHIKGGQLRRAETIECIVIRVDGQRMPADIDLRKFYFQFSLTARKLERVGASGPAGLTAKRCQLVLFR